MNEYNPFSLKNKNIFITGASSGIGRRTAIECSHLGARLIVTGRDTKRLEEAYASLLGTGHRQVVADLTDGADLSRLVEQCSDLDGVVLCAGKGRVAPFKFCTRDKFDDVFDVNFFAPVELLRLLVKGGKLRQGASVVFVASVGGCAGGKFTIGNDIYGASKSALWSMMKFAALELAPKKIRANSVHPGMVDTPLIHHGVITDEQHQQDVANYPLKRYGRPEDVAYGIVYLLSDASSWVTGQSLVIDGGLTL